LPVYNPRGGVYTLIWEMPMQAAFAKEALINCLSSDTPMDLPKSCAKSAVHTAAGQLIGASPFE
jgi:hypothetical protein